MLQSLGSCRRHASCHLGGTVRDVIDRAAPPDIVEMGIKEAAGGALAVLVQALERNRSRC